MGASVTVHKANALNRNMRFAIDQAVNPHAGLNELIS